MSWLISEAHSGRGSGSGGSPGAGLEPCVQATVPLFPVGWTGLDWVAGIQAIQGQGFEFVNVFLVGTEQALQVRLDSDALRLGFRAQARFEVRMDDDTHSECSVPSFQIPLSV